jgi:hypothetical protein
VIAVIPTVIINIIGSGERGVQRESFSADFGANILNVFTYLSHSLTLLAINNSSSVDFAA